MRRRRKRDKPRNFAAIAAIVAEERRWLPAPRERVAMRRA
jgi:hypothetical protein